MNLIIDLTLRRNEHLSPSSPRFLEWEAKQPLAGEHLVDAAKRNYKEKGPYSYIFDGTIYFSREDGGWTCRKYLKGKKRALAEQFVRACNENDALTFREATCKDVNWLPTRGENDFLEFVRILNGVVKKLGFSVKITKYFKDDELQSKIDQIFAA